MSESVIHRLRFTPVGDLIRGRISGRLDFNGAIERSNLPPLAKDLILRLVKRTRLWLSEKVDVASELIAHFADGIESGRSVEVLIEKFGDERRAAKLIRRAKKRNRPLTWHILRGLGWIALVMLAIYAFLAARFVLSHPSPKIDYVAQMNQANLAMPQQQRAWPIYRKALLALGDRQSKEADDRFNLIFDARPGSPNWAMVKPWLVEHAQVLELTRQGATKPALGFIFGANGSMVDAELYPGMAALQANYDDELRGRAVISILLPHLNDLNLLANILSTDARSASEDGDMARVLADIETLVNLAEQIRRDGGFMVTDMVAMGRWSMALHTAEETLARKMDKLSDSDLQKLAHLLSRPKSPSDLLSVEGERRMFHDLVQRTYSDDGNGDGHLTFQGQRFLDVIASPMPVGNKATMVEAAAVAVTPAVALSRREASERYDRLLDIAEGNLRRPMREADWHSYDQEAIASLDFVTRHRLLPLPALEVHSFASFHESAERELGHRDGIVTGIAMESYRRKHGKYPSAVEALTPDFLPEIPRDRITGEPLKFVVKDGGVIIYSVGADRKDDGGRPPRKSSGEKAPLRAARWNLGDEKPADGDWVLYPQGVEEN